MTIGANLYFVFIILRSQTNLHLYVSLHIINAVEVGRDKQPYLHFVSNRNYTLTFAPVLHRVSTLTPTPLLLSSLADMLEAGLIDGGKIGGCRGLKLVVYNI